MALRETNTQLIIFDHDRNKNEQSSLIRGKIDISGYA